MPTYLGKMLVQYSHKRKSTLIYLMYCPESQIETQHFIHDPTIFIMTKNFKVVLSFTYFITIKWFCL